MTTDEERRLERLAEELRSAGVRHVVATMVDSGSITRVKCFSLEDLASFVRSGSGFSILWALVLSNDHFTTTEAIKGPVGDIRMLPDPAAVVQLAATPEWAWAPMDLYDQEGAPLSVCPRGFLKRMTAQAAERGYAVRMAYELEWFLGEAIDDDSAVPVHRGPGYSSNAWALTHGFSAALLDALGAQGIRVSQLHPEYSPGQMEVSLGVADPLSAADWHVLFRHTVRALSAEYGWRSSFSPITVPGLGNGSHLHFSLYDQVGKSLFCDGDGVIGLTATGESFLAGVLAELSAIIAIACPTVPSYERLRPQALGRRLSRLGSREPRSRAALHHRDGRRPPGHRQHGVQGGGLRRAPVPPARRDHRRRSERYRAGHDAPRALLGRPGLAHGGGAGSRRLRAAARQLE